MTFEEAYAKLEKIIERISSGSEPLGQALELYQEANDLIGICQKQLLDAEEKVEALIKTREGALALDETGKPQTEPFNPSKVTTFASS
jgi:exodeoxyribonuclease VII small subunit